MSEDVGAKAVILKRGRSYAYRGQVFKRNITQVTDHWRHLLGTGAFIEGEMESKITIRRKAEAFKEDAAEKTDPPLEEGQETGQASQGKEAPVGRFRAKKSAANWAMKNHGVELDISEKLVVLNAMTAALADGSYAEQFGDPDGEEEDPDAAIDPADDDDDEGETAEV